MVILAQGLRANYEDNVELKAEFDKRPTIDQFNLRFIEERAYIDAQDNQILKYIDAQDDKILKYIEQHSAEQHRAEADRMELIKSVDGNVKILLNRLK